MTDTATAPAVRRALDALAETLREARDRTRALIAPVDAADLTIQHDPLMSPIVWDLGHIARFEELWLTRNLDGPVSGMGVCAPLGGLFGDDCSPGRPPCQTGTCLDLGTARVCTVPCAPGCPPNFTCRKAQLLSGADAGAQQVDVCFPVGGGQAGAACAFGPAACESGLCIRKGSGPVCTQTCTADAGCPAGWRCAQVLTVDNQSLQACLPPSL